MSAEAVGGLKGRLCVDLGIGFEAAYGRFRQGFAAGLEARAGAGFFRDGQANPVYGDAIADSGFPGQFAQINGEQDSPRGRSNRLYRANSLYKSCEHSQTVLNLTRFRRN